MKSFFVTIFAETRAASHERMAVALLLMPQTERGQAYFGLSMHKLQLVRSLIGKEPSRVLRWNLDALSKSVATHNGKEAVPLLFDAQQGGGELTKGYLTYLSRYQNNLTQYAAPVGLDLPADQETFDWLFSENVDDIVTSVPIVKQTDFRALIRRPVIEQRFNLRVRADAKIDPQILFPTYVDLLGKNERMTYGKIIDLTRPNRFNTQDAVSFYGLSQQTPGSKHFVISKEPDKRQLPLQHQSWVALRDSASFTYVDASEIERIEAYAIEHNVRPVLGAGEEE